MITIRVWDLPTRVFHWALVLCVASLFISGNVGGDWLVWHMRAGYAVGALLLFRLVWGLVGGHWSRFATFFPSPARLRAYLRSNEGAGSAAGHNPLGALSVFAMLTALMLQVGTGLFVDDEIAFTGPLYRFVSGQTSQLATWYHTGMGKITVLVLVVLHLSAIAFYRAVKHRRLVSAMLSGHQTVEGGEALPSAQDTAKTRLLAVGVLVVCALVMAWVASLDNL